MPKTSEMRESKFLKKEDVGRGALFVVADCKQFNVAMSGAEPEMKWCLVFEDEAKPLVLNSTNTQLCEHIFASDDTDDWVGKELVLYSDPNVSYAGKLVGGIRVRAPKVKPAAAAKPTRGKPAPVEEPPDIDDDPIPF